MEKKFSKFSLAKENPEIWKLRKERKTEKQITEYNDIQPDNSVKSNECS